MVGGRPGFSGGGGRWAARWTSGRPSATGSRAPWPRFRRWPPLEILAIAVRRHRRTDHLAARLLGSVARGHGPGRPRRRHRGASPLVRGEMSRDVAGLIPKPTKTPLADGARRPPRWGRRRNPRAAARRGAGGLAERFGRRRSLMVPGRWPPSSITAPGRGELRRHREPARCRSSSPSASSSLGNRAPGAAELMQ